MGGYIGFDIMSVRSVRKMRFVERLHVCQEMLEEVRGHGVVGGCGFDHLPV